MKWTAGRSTGQIKNKMRQLLIFISFLWSSQLFPQTLSIEQVRSDIDTVISVLSDIHPTFNGSPSKKELLRLRDTIGIPLTSHGLFKTLQPLVTLDGHTTLQCNATIYPDVSNPLLPFETVIYNSRLYVRRNLSADSSITKGTEITGINGIKTPDIIANIMRYLPGEKINYKTRKLDNDAFPNWYRLVYGNYETFEIGYINNGTPGRSTVEGTHWKYFSKAQEDPNEFKLLENDIAYLKVGRFTHPREFMPFMDSVFSVIKALQLQNLIIDKTQGGGFTSLADSLISYLTDEPHREFEKKKVRISRESEEYINEMREHGKQEGEYFIVTMKPVSPVYHPNRFRGNVYILTGPRAYSAATLFVSMARCYTDATIVGEETGQPLISNADFSRHKLPNSGLNLFTSHSIYYMPCAGNRNDGVKPDIEVKRNLDDLLNETDRYLGFTLDLIKQKQSE